MISIREAALSDLEKVAELFDQYRCFYEQSSDLPLASRFIGARIANNESVILVAEGEGGELAGFTQLYPSFSSISAAQPMYSMTCMSRRTAAAGEWGGPCSKGPGRSGRPEERSLFRYRPRKTTRTLKPCTSPSDG